MGPRGENGFHDLRGRAAALGRPPDQPLWRPSRIMPVGFRHVRRDRTVTALEAGALVARHPCALVKDFDDLGTEADLKLLLAQGVGHRVIVPFDFEVIVNIDACEFPLRVGIWPRRQWFQGGAVERLKQALSRAGQFFEGLGIERRQERRNRRI